MKSFTKIIRLTAALLTMGILAACSDGAPQSGSEPESPSDNVRSESSADLEASSESGASDSSETSESLESGAEIPDPVPDITPINTEPDYEWDKVIALTFDDGPNTETTNEVLDMLEKHQVTASFFLIGNNINEESAEAVKRAHALGCEINNHSRSHGYMNEMSADEIKAEYDYVDEKVLELTGAHTAFFRPPYIAVSDGMWDNIEVPFIAGIGCNDWDDAVTADRRVTSILRQAQDGCIILLHDAEGNHKTVEAIDRIIPELKAQGYRFTTVSGLFEAKGITPTTKMIYSNVTQTGMWG